MRACGETRVTEGDRGTQLFSGSEPAIRNCHRGYGPFSESKRGSAGVTPIRSLQLSIRKCDERAAWRSQLNGYNDTVD